jgi:hypothetical protein
LLYFSTLMPSSLHLMTSTMVLVLIMTDTPKIVDLMYTWDLCFLRHAFFQNFRTSCV